MSFWDRLRNTTRQATGHGKQRVGRKTGDRGLERKGRTDRYVGGVKQFGERAKDATRDLRKSFRK